MQRIVIVDEDDNYVGEEEKEKCHDGGGILHRAFLAMVFNESGELLLTQRSMKKRLWPGFWDGTVASHVMRGEGYEEASRRRLRQEIGLETDRVEYLFKFRYKAGYRDVGTEHEICAVTLVRGVQEGLIMPDEGEISEIKYVDPHILTAELGEGHEDYTPWFLLAVKEMNSRYFGLLFEAR